MAGVVGAPSVLAVESFCPGGGTPSPNVVMCEDFADSAARTRWDINSHRSSWPIDQFVLCTNDSFGFKDRCAAWSNHLVFDGQWGFWGYDAWRPFPSQSEFYVRWYQFISDPFIWGTLEDKSVLLHDSIDSITAYVGTSRNHLPVEPNSGPGMPFVANYQDLDWLETGGQATLVNRFQNQGNNITLQRRRWYLFEWYIKLNTPGVSNGVTRLWIDDATQPIPAQTLRMRYEDMRWLRSSDTVSCDPVPNTCPKRFGFLRLSVYDQRCDGARNTCPPNGPAILAQSHRWDQIVISKAPIGPILGSRPPAAPTGLRIVR